MQLLTDPLQIVDSSLSKHALRRWPVCISLVSAALFTIPAWPEVLTGAGLSREQQWSNPVINEMMYHPPDEQDELQFIELPNAGSNRLDLAGWSISGQVRFRFCWGTIMEPREYAVVCCDIAAFRREFGPGVTPLGTLEGRLSHRGGAISLIDPAGRVIESVSYTDRLP